MTFSRGTARRRPSRLAETALFGNRMTRRTMICVGPTIGLTTTRMPWTPPGRRCARSAFAYRDIGCSYAKLRRHNEAIDAHRHAARISLEADELLELGIAFGNANRYDKAEETNKKSLSLKPSDVAYACLGGIYYGGHVYGQAMNYARKAILLDPKYPHAHYILAKLRLKPTSRL